MMHFCYISGSTPATGNYKNTRITAFQSNYTGVFVAFDAQITLFLFWISAKTEFFRYTPNFFGIYATRRCNTKKPRNNPGFYFIPPHPADA